MKITTLARAPAPRYWPLFLLVALTVCYVIAAITPPFQSPDEFDHVKRSYMYGHGQLMLHSIDGAPSGGEVDTGLLEYMDHFTDLPGKANRKISSDELTAAGQVKWTGTDRMATPVGTAYYFPVLYTPQAIGLVGGQLVGLSVGQSYRLARFLTLFSSLALIYFACRIFSPPPALLAVLVLPMNLFLMSSTSLDGMTTATAAVAMAAFMRIAHERRTTPTWVLHTLTVTLVLLTACRANVLPFLLLPFVVWWFLRDRRSLVTAIVTAVLVCAWTLYTVKFTVYPQGPRHIDHAAKLASYVIHPGTFAHMLYATLSNVPVLSYYATSFIGTLGWLDTPFQPGAYYLMAVLLVVAFMFSFSRDAVVEQRLARGTLVLCVIATVLMTYLAMLVQWTIGDSEIIQGVQGRYFMIPAVALAYIIGGDLRPHAGIANTIATIAVAALLAVGTYTTSWALVARYHTALTQNSASLQPMLKPTLSLTPDSTVPVRLSPAQTANPASLDRIDIMFGTYAHTHPGKAALRMWTNSGDTIVVPFELSSVVDNGYKRFELDGKPYVGGELVPQGGEGVAIWESHIGDILQMACVRTYTHDGRSALTPGCPQP